MKAIVNVPVCALQARPTRESTTVDEALYGMTVDILEEVEPGWVRIRTHYRYEGIAHTGDLLMDDQKAAAWEQKPKKVVLTKNFTDVQSEPRVQGWQLITLPRGAVVSPMEETQDGWQRVKLADGRTGWVPEHILGTYHAQPVSQDEDTLRHALVEAAMRYQGTHYRWGGKSPMGIDCSGLCSMAYLLCGVIIYRDADIEPGFPIHEITLEEVKPGDLLFFPGHVAMYIGEGKYCHSTARSGSDGFTINSLRPEDPEYRADLAGMITQVGSYFQKG